MLDLFRVPRNKSEDFSILWRDFFLQLGFPIGEKRKLGDLRVSAVRLKQVMRWKTFEILDWFRMNP